MQKFIKEKLPQCFDDQGIVKKTTNELHVEFLKTTKKAGFYIDSPAKFEEFVQATADMYPTPLERNRLNEVFEQAKKDHPEYRTASVRRKNQAADDEIAKKQYKIQDLQAKKAKRIEDLQNYLTSQESVETLSETIDASYLDELAATTSLHPKHQEQLTNMKNLLATNPNCTIQRERLTIQEGVLLIDGYTIPSDLVQHPGQSKGSQKYEDMNNSGSKFLYAEGFLKMINFMGEMGGKKFNQGELNSTNLRDRSLLKEDILEQLKLGNNNDILRDLAKVVNLEGNFPIGLDEDGYIIYAIVHPVIIGFGFDFSRFDSNFNCLASSNWNKTPLNGGVS